MLRQHGCSGTRWEVAFSSPCCLTGGTGSGGVELKSGAGEVSGGRRWLTLKIRDSKTPGKLQGSESPLLQARL